MTGGIVVFAIGLALLGVTWFREWNGWTAFGAVVMGAAICATYVVQVFEVVFARQYRRQVISEMPDGTFAPEQAVEVGDGATAVFILW
ncbi:hypothetical protein OB919_18210 [Halobacteria archaeon AArc-curdl1]|uniref:Uncharacterized protein n=1 Tax=Natronosalvus hydrolyticus TaxID=2979988 RepID=A0AAP2ZDF2_9EURY|nr:hypothetical protein [Halobacteria archaeon AArc-curdl1]